MKKCCKENKMKQTKKKKQTITTTTKTLKFSMKNKWMDHL